MHPCTPVPRLTGRQAEGPLMHRHCVAWSDRPDEPAANGIIKRSIPGSGASLVMVRVPAGTMGDKHSHPHEQFVQVISGSGTIETEDGAIRFIAGTVFHFPKDTRHQAIFDTETVLVETNLVA